MRVRTDVDSMEGFAAELRETVRVLAEKNTALKRRAKALATDARVQAVEHEFNVQTMMITNRLDELRSLTAWLERLAEHLRLYLGASPTSSPRLSLRTPLAPNGGLMAHEATLARSRFGHTIKKHIAWAIEDLKDRLRNEKKLTRVSTFKDRAEAEAGVAMVFADPVNQKKLANWLADDSRTRQLYLDAPFLCGRILMRGSSKTVHGISVLVILRKDDRHGYVISTAFPQIKRE